MHMQIALKFDPVVTKAMKEVFGRKLLVRDQTAAESFSGSAGMDCVTMEGDEVGRKGGITGISNSITYNTTATDVASTISTATVITTTALPQLSILLLLVVLLLQLSLLVIQLLLLAAPMQLVR
jgi:hypothetical protein